MDNIKDYQEFLGVVADVVKCGMRTPNLPRLTTKLRAALASVGDLGSRWFDTAIKDLDLSVRSRKCMRRQNIVTIRELTNTTAKELLQLKNFGLTSLAEVREKLGSLGLKLLNDPDPE